MRERSSLLLKGVAGQGARALQQGCFVEIIKVFGREEGFDKRRNSVSFYALTQSLF